MLGQCLTRIIAHHKHRARFNLGNDSAVLQILGLVRFGDDIHAFGQFGDVVAVCIESEFEFEGHRVNLLS